MEGKQDMQGEQQFIFQNSDPPACEGHRGCRPVAPTELRRAPGPVATAPLPCQPPPGAWGSSREGDGVSCRHLGAFLVLTPRPRPCPLGSVRPSQNHLQRTPTFQYFSFPFSVVVFVYFFGWLIFTR